MVVFEGVDEVVLPEEGQRLLQVAKKALVEGSAQKALEQYILVADACRDNKIRREAYIGAAKASLDLLRAEDAYRYATSIPGAEKDITALFLKAQSILRMRKYEDAIAAFKQVADIAPASHSLTEPIIKGLFEAHSLSQASKSTLVTEYGFQPEEIKDLPMSEFLKRTLSKTWKGICIDVDPNFLCESVRYGWSCVAKHATARW
eukprot:CAMPEP_0113902788 /NCGR_PEP_ID=MMETSP0780_2-20120614/22063_1 /TAXON_ID=652834 /ORGANISM="Palpitomonas bilix" /LENGTH=203 /DNA_ID=CAMNT_0000895669 /DNA_START=173 /DNA_END=781 /DNA_ORIENTATION=+ /assembly_acc=CAM_ASM_000599